MSYTVWQIAAGDPGRNYSRVFLEHDVMFLGPGGYGPYREKEDAYWELVNNKIETSNKIGAIRSFANSVKPGDRIILRIGHRVLAIGLIPDDEDYSWSELYEEVHGWDLNHYRRVIWQDQHEVSLSAIQLQKDLFGNRKQIPMFTAVKDSAVLGPIKSLLDDCDARVLKELPKLPAKSMDLDDFGAALFGNGLSFDSVEKVKLALQRQRSFSSWYWHFGKESGRPTEAEVVAHLIVPLLLALGWSEQLLAVEWHRVDLAAFWGTPTTPERCQLVVEAKGIGHGLIEAYDQARKYVQNVKLDHCTKILLTEGQSLYLYDRPGQYWPQQAPEPAGYLNVNSLRKEYLSPKGADAVKTLMALTPTGVGRSIE